MKLHHRIEDNVCVVFIKGEIIVSKAYILEDYLEPILTNESITGLVLNLDKVQSIDSTGMGELIIASRRLEDRGGKTSLCFSNKRVVQAFEMAKLDTFFNIFNTEEEAIIEVR